MRTLEEVVEMLAELLDLFGWNILAAEEKEYIDRMTDRSGEYMPEDAVEIERLYKKYKKGGGNLSDGRVI